MKKISLLLFCVLLGLQAKSQHVNAITVSLAVGLDVPAHGKSSNLFGALEIDRSFAKDKLVIGMVMSGKNEITRFVENEDSSLVIQGQYFLVGLVAGFKVSKERNWRFCGTGVGGTFVTVWDNYKLNPEFPLAGGPYMQVVCNLFDKPEEDEVRYGIIFRSTYLIYGYKTTDPYDKGSLTTPGFQFKLGGNIIF